MLHGFFFIENLFQRTRARVSRNVFRIRRKFSLHNDGATSEASTVKMST
jgi:hypothetical protein